MFRHPCNDRCLEVFAVRQCSEAFHVGRRHNNSHSLLRFADCQFRTVQPIVFLRDSVQVNFQTIRQFADGNGNAARAKVITPLNQTGSLGIAEQSLQLSLLRRIALLYLCAAAFQRFQRMRF